MSNLRGLLGGTPAERCRMRFGGHDMLPCPKCGSYDLRYQTPIQVDEPLPDEPDARQILGIWARAMKSGQRLLKGPCYIACFECFHRGPAMDCSGRTSDDVGRDPAVAEELRRLWNEQESVGDIRNEKEQ